MIRSKLYIKGAAFSLLTLTLSAIGEESAYELQKEALFNRFLEGERSVELAEAAENIHEVASHRFNELHSDNYILMIILSMTYETLGRYDDALPKFEQLLRIAENPEGDDSDSLVTSLNDLGRIHGKLNHHEEAESFHQRAVSAATEVYDRLHTETATSLNYLGLLYNEMERFSESESHFQQALEIRRAVLEKGDPEIAQTMDHLGELYSSMGNFRRLEEIYRELLEILPEDTGSDYPDRRKILGTLGIITKLDGNYEDAEKFFRERLLVCESKYPEDLRLLSDANEDLAELFYDLRRFPEAVPLFEKHVSILDQYFETPVLEHSESRLSLSRALMEVDDIDGAVRIIQETIRIEETLLPANDPEIANNWNHLGNALRKDHQFAEAGEAYDRTIAILEVAATSDPLALHAALAGKAQIATTLMHFEVAEDGYRQALALLDPNDEASRYAIVDAVQGLGLACQENGKLVEAKALLLQAIEEYRALYKSETHPNLLTCRSELARLEAQQGHLAEADAEFARIRDLAEEAYTVSHPVTLKILLNLALLKETLGQNAAAADLYDIIEQNLELVPIEAGVLLGNRAGLLHSLGEFEKAEALYRKAIDVLGDQLGFGHPMVSSFKSNFAILLHRRGNTREAFALIKEDYELLTERLGPRNQSTLIAMGNLASMHQTHGRIREAEQLSIERQRISEEEFEAGHPVRVRGLKNLATLYLATSQQDEAVAFASRYMTEEGIRHDRVMSYFSEDECLQYLEHLKSESPLDLAGAIGNGRVVAEALLRFKGAVAGSLAVRRAVEGAFTEGSAEHGLLLEQQQLASEIRQEVLEGKSVSDELQRDFDRISKQLAERLPSGFSGQANISLSDVQGRLEDDTVLVDFFRFSMPPSSPDGVAHYASCLIRSTGDPVFVQHGRASEIDRKIGEYRKLVSASDTHFKNSESALFHTLLDPVLSRLRQGERVVFCPAGQINFLPLGLLRNASGIPFAAQHPVQLVNSGRDLCGVGKREESRSPNVMLLGGVDYKATAGSGDAFDGENRFPPPTNRGALRLTFLQGTVAEIETVGALFEKAGYHVETLRGEGASEPNFMERARNFDVIHLATHGFFLPELGVLRGSAGGLEGMPSGTVSSARNPMLRSGIALSGAQLTFDQWNVGKVPPMGSDGILMADEMSRLDLSATRLVVLSACDTGIGESLDGEGIFGLRRALYTAGVGHVILTLWPVDDLSTVELMTLFYKKFLEGKSPDRALIESQVELLPKWVEAYGEAKAMNWIGAFICTGRAGRL